MHALTLLLIVDMCNREFPVRHQYDKPAIYQPDREINPHIISPAVLDQDSECFAYKKPAWAEI